VETADAIWTKWLPESGEAVTDPAVMLERYGEGFNPQTGMGDVEVWLSIK
jgi:AraC family transcriptional regulator